MRACSASGIFNAPPNKAASAAVPITTAYGLGGALGAAVLSLAAAVFIFQRRSRRDQEQVAGTGSMTQTEQSPSRLKRWTSKWKQNVRTVDPQPPAEQQTFVYQYPGQTIGAAFNRWTTRLSQYRPGYNANQMPVDNQDPTVFNQQVASDYYAPNPVMNQEYQATGTMSANNPQYGSGGQSPYGPPGF
jgi:hypothetical protein